MTFDLTIGTEKAIALQNSIQDELTTRGYSQDADPVMAEYITIMLINNKTADQITAELQDLIGVSEYDASFTEWLFAEAAKKSESQPESQTESHPPAATQASPPPRESSKPPQPDPQRRAPSAPRSGAAPIYNQALSQALPSGSQSGHKRSASARSPSPNNNQQPNKTRRTDLPTAPRAMQHGGGRSLLERMGGRQRGNHRDEIQARIDAVTQAGMHPQDMMGQMNGFNGGMMMGGPGPMDMGAMVNPLALQEVMMNQMALMAQMANSMGLLNPQGQFMNNGAQGFPMNGGFPSTDGQGVPGQHQQQHGGNRRGGGPPGRGRGRGGATGPSQWVAPHVQEAASATSAPAQAAPQVVAPVPKPAPVAEAPSAADATAPGFTPPERPQSPTLCKFALKCTNALCRYSHPSPVATPESGIVLSNDACEAGKNCKDKDCIKAHVSPAAVNVTRVQVPHKPEPTSAPVQIPCRYGANCLRISSGCPYLHPSTSTYNTQDTHAPHSHFNQQCRFGAGCTRAACPFQHPPGRVLPGTFHRGLSERAPVVAVPKPETGSMGGPSPHRSVVFNKPVTSAAVLAKRAAEAAAEAEQKADGADAAEVEASVVPSTSTVQAAA